MKNIAKNTTHLLIIPTVSVKMCIVSLHRVKKGQAMHPQDILDIENSSKELVVRRANALIYSKWNGPLFDKQIMAIAMTKLECENVNGVGELVARLYPGQIQRLFGNKKIPHLYTKLREMSARIVKNSVCIIEDGKGNFKVMAQIVNCDYTDGVLEIKFNNKIRDYLYDLKGNYTVDALRELLQQETLNSYKVYELLHSFVYASDPNVNGGKVEKIIGVSELRFMLGLADIHEPAITTEIDRMQGAIDWDYLYENVAIKKKYKEWRDLRRDVLEKSQQVINKISDINFEFEGINIGNAVRMIKFIIWPVKKTAVLPEKQKEERGEPVTYQEEEQRSIPGVIGEEIYREFVGHNDLYKEDIDLLMQRAHYDASKVRRAIELADQQPEIRNYMGWIIRCIEKDYKNPVETVEGSAVNAKRIKEIKAEAANPDLAERIWLKTQEKSDFNEFILTIGMTVEEIDLIYDNPKEKVQLYTDWRIGKL